MILLNAEALELQGIPYRAASKIVLKNRLFVKGQSLSKRLRRAAVSLCKGYIKAGTDCILVETEEHYTLWREDKFTPLPTASTVTRSTASQSGSSNPSVTYSAEDGVIRIQVAPDPKLAASAQPA